MTKKKSTLEKIGLSAEQAKIYTLLVQNNPLSPTDIVRLTKIHRPAVYEALEQLIKLDLIRTVPFGKNKKYTAESPEHLEKLFKDIEDDFNSEIYHLRDAYELKDRKPRVTFAQGDKAIKDTFADVVHELKKGDTYYRYSPSLAKEYYKYLPADYRHLRDKKQLERFVITDQESAAKMNKKLGKGVRTIPRGMELFDTKINQWIFGDKVVFVDYNSKSIITVENKKIAQFQKAIFKLLYEKLG